VVVADELHGYEGAGCRIALADGPTPGVEAGRGQAVTGTEGADTQTTLLPLANPATPLLFFARIARSTVEHNNALLSEGITPRPSTTLLAGQTRTA
jgi:hypothetical protein